MNASRAALACILLMATASRSKAVDEAVDFDRDVAPLLAARCLECHNAADRKGELDLSSSTTALRRTDPVLVPGQLDDSLVWKQLSDDQMPPKHPLAVREKAIFKAWIAAGAKWGSIDPIDRFAYSTDTRAGTDWWSLQPVHRPEPPEVKHSARVENPIDAFVLAKLEAEQLGFAPPADRRTLIRRAYFDLIGLPPTPAEVEAFIDDPAPDAYRQLIDRLLASTHYGERWARHWLDVARYTESQGFEYDRFRPNAWHYRDYVIAAFNDDKPYNIFLQEQIAGDVVNFAVPTDNATSDGIIATSLLVCGPWDQAGNSQANATQKKITREEELEDLVSVIGQTFLGMTVNCARCHSHKFDPIPQEDYYRFKAVFEGVRHGERSIESEAEKSVRLQRLTALKQERATIEKRLFDIERQVRLRIANELSGQSPDGPVVLGPEPYARWTFDDGPIDSVGEMHGALIAGAAIRDGRLVLSGRKQYMVTQPIQQDFTEKTLEAWVSLGNLEQRGGGLMTLETKSGKQFDSIVFGEKQARGWLAGSDTFKRTQPLEAEPESAPLGEFVQLAIAYRSDKTIAVYRNGRPYGEAYSVSALQSYKIDNGQVLLGLRHTDSTDGFFAGEIESASLYAYALDDQEVADSFAAGVNGGRLVVRQQMSAAMTAVEKAEHSAASRRRDGLGQEIEHISKDRLSYTGLRQQPEPTHRLNRGDVKSPGEVVSPGGLSNIKSLPGDLGLSPDAPDARRRFMLAAWLADPRHPLTSRVMVNRIWHHHFGRGIVETPNDFGFNGGRPSHPQLLDWLAAEFVEGSKPWSMKHLHRLIMTSATYQQSSSYSQRAAEMDADNRWLWRFSPRRLEGEIIRDAMLAVSGQLNVSMGGPSFMPFIITKFNSDFYQPIDPLAAEFQRRTIYRAHINSGKSPMMDALDCPDPSIKMPARRVTTTPLAALAMMNNSFVLRQAEYLAERVRLDSHLELGESIDCAYRTCFGRPATVEEMREAMVLVNAHGLKSLCWALLNATEFIYIQ